MAKMIPASIVSDKMSKAERDKIRAELKVFNLLKDDPYTEKWTILHSLELARRGKRKPYGEIDFVVIIPKEGIICLEVKGGGISYDKEKGQWKSRDYDGKEFLLSRSPFVQSRDSMDGLRNSIIQHFGEGSRESQCPTGCMVVFPDADSPPSMPGFESCDVIDWRGLRDRPISSSIMNNVRNRLREFQRSRKREEPVPIPSEVEKISKFLRPDFECIPAKGPWLEEEEQELIRLTEEQYERIDELADNPRCLFEGAAGTGKTLLALEFSRREDEKGEKVLFICYNQLLSQYFKEWTEGTNITSGTFHGVVKNLIEKSKYHREFSEKECELLKNDKKKLFDEIYPFYGEMALEQLGPQFDLLVMDEAQDLCREETLNVLDVAICGGLSSGRWAVFGDFSRQNIYDYGKKEDIIRTLESYCKHPVRNKLMRNCRNTGRIAKETYLLSGFQSPPSRFTEEQGPPVEYEYWKSPDDFKNRIERKIKNLIKEGISIEDIVILSPRRLKSSILAEVKKISGFPLEDGSRDLKIMEKKKVIKFSTIHSFKGLERPVIIVVDIEEVRGDSPQSLLYVSMSRAKSLLILMINKRFKKLIDEIKKPTKKYT